MGIRGIYRGFAVRGQWCGPFFFDKKSSLKAGNKCFGTSQVERLSLSTFANKHRHKMAWNRSI